MLCWSATGMPRNARLPPSTSRAFSRAASLTSRSTGLGVPFCMVCPRVQSPRSEIPLVSRCLAVDRRGRGADRLRHGRRRWCGVLLLVALEVVRERLLEDALGRDERVDLADERRELIVVLERRGVVVGDRGDDVV